jgi:M6 family metalloprotease-like protein
MRSRPVCGLLVLGSFLVACCLSVAADSKPDPKTPDLSEYRTAEKAVASTIKTALTGPAGQTGYLGVSVERDGRGRLVVEEVQPDSPAAKAGVKKGDVVTRVGEQAVKTPQAFREWLQAHGPGETLKLDVLREDKPVELSATLVAVSRPMKAGAQRVYLGVELGEAKEGEGVGVDRVTPGSPAADAGLKGGDRILKADGTDIVRASRLTDLLSEKKPGDVLTLAVRRDGKEIELKAKLSGDRRGRGEDAAPVVWKKELFRLAVVCIEFPDVKHNGKGAPAEWEKALFSKGEYRDKSATGQAVHGSLNDYFLEQSAGAFRLEGRVFDWVEVGKKRGDYSEGSGTSGKTALLTEALEKVTARDGKEAFKDFDGFLFLYAGEAVRTNRGAIFYPHSGSLNFQTKRWPYLLGVEGGSKLTSISGFAKEFGQVLGLPDLAARTENVGSEGLGVWCVMSNPNGDGKPQHLSAWAKEKLGWIKPTMIDPTVKQKLILSPIEDSPKECFKVLVRPNGSEYFLLENRSKKGFDAGLPGEGLLIWRVVNDRPILEESHGVEGPTGPTVHLSAVPYPSQANNSFTPDTTPSSRSPQGGGLPVHITDIRRLADGRITFHIGYEYR